MPNDRYAFEGACHCGAIGFTFCASQPPESWAVRACQCSFCRAHGARTTSDPDGSVTFCISDASQLHRYQFGARSADFFLCRNCGVYLAAMLSSSAGQFATLNVNTIQAPIQLPGATVVSYEGQSVEQKTARRERLWTPLAIPI
jgi:hypothetical protein